MKPASSPTRNARSAAITFTLPLSRVQMIRDAAGQSALLVERFDRVGDDDGGPRRLAVEDASQIMGLYPAGKYDVAYGTLCKELTQLCDAPLLAVRNLALQLVFAWLTGNGDLHAKNVPLLQDAHGRIAVAPIHDIPRGVTVFRSANQKLGQSLEESTQVDGTELIATPERRNRYAFSSSAITIFFWPIMACTCAGLCMRAPMLRGMICQLTPN